MKLQKDDQRKLELLATGAWPYFSGNESATKNLRELGLAEVAPHPEIPNHEIVQITERGQSYLNGENVLSERREKIMERALAALRMVISLQELTADGSAVPRDGEGAYLVELPPEAEEVVRKSADELTRELKLVF